MKSGDITDITGQLEDIVRKSKIKNGLCNIFSLGSTGAVIINEDDPMLLQDIQDSLNKISSEKEIYQHPYNAHSHIRTTILGSDKTIPIENGKLALGTWQSIMVINYDIKNRERNFMVTIIGE